MRGATNRYANGLVNKIISIHAPHAGRDTSWRRRSRAASNFNPRAPCGARLGTQQMPLVGHAFQSTRPMRGATNDNRAITIEVAFQSTRPMRGATTTWPVRVR